MKLSALALCLLTACQTQFQGDPKVPNGPAGCVEICRSWRMELVGMIAMGEYSDGCICEVPGRAPSAPGAPSAAVRAVGAAGPAAAGVFMQMQRAEQQRQQQMMR